MALSSGIPRRKTGEPTIALINVVFLMLVFFLIAGTLARPLDKELKLVSASEVERRPPPDALVAFPDGRLVFRGEPATAAGYVAAMAAEGQARADADGPSGIVARLVPDRDLPAAGLLALVAALREAGAVRVLIVTQRALQ